MTWDEIRNHPSLRKLPYKIEMSEWGNIEASPLGVDHARYQARIAQILQRLKPEGASSTEAAVETSEYVKVPDVIWASVEHSQTVPHDPVWKRAPEICVEIFTPGDPPEERTHKAHLYLEAGATEYWTCNELGAMQFRNADGSLEQSQLCPEFPANIEILGQA